MSDTARAEPAEQKKICDKTGESSSTVNADEYLRSEKSTAIGASAVNRPTISLAACAQTKVTVGEPGDRYEREADSVADKVRSGRDAGTISRIPPGGLRAQTEADESAQERSADTESMEGKQPEDHAEQQAETDVSGDGGDDSKSTEVQEMCSSCEQHDSARQVENDPTATGAARKSPSDKQGLETIGSTSCAQTKVAVGGADDGYEREADAVSDRVSRGRDAGAISSVQRQSEEGGVTDGMATGDEQAVQERGEDAQQENDIPADVQSKCAECDETSAQTQDDPAPNESERDDEASGEAVVQRDGGADPDQGSSTEAQTIRGEDDPDAPDCAVESEAAETSAPAPEESATSATQSGEQGGEGAQQTSGDDAQSGCAGGAGAEDEVATPEAGPSEDPEAEQSCGGSPESDAAEGAAGAAGSTGSQGPSSSASEAPEPQAPPACAEVVSEPDEQTEESAASSSDQASEEGGCQGVQTKVSSEAAADDSESSGEESASEAPEQVPQSQQSQVEPESTGEHAQTADVSGENSCAKSESEAETEVQTRTPERPRPDRKSLIAGRAIQQRDAGVPLAQDVREPLEASLRADLAPVRVHTGAQAEAANRGLKSRAFTHREHVWLAAGERPSDLKLIAHELTHSVQQGAIQQNAEPSRRPDEPDRADQSDHSLAREMGPVDSEGGREGPGERNMHRSADATDLRDRPHTDNEMDAEFLGASDSGRAGRDEIQSGDAEHRQTPGRSAGSDVSHHDNAPDQRDENDFSTGSDATKRGSDPLDRQAGEPSQRSRGTEEGKAKEDSDALVSNRTVRGQSVSQGQPAVNTSRDETSREAPQESGRDGEVGGGGIETSAHQGAQALRESSLELDAQPSADLSPARSGAATDRSGRPTRTAGARPSDLPAAGGQLSDRAGQGPVSRPKDRANAATGASAQGGTSDASAGGAGSGMAASQVQAFTRLSPLRAPFAWKTLRQNLTETATARREQEQQRPPTLRYRPRAPGLMAETAQAERGRIRDKQAAEPVDTPAESDRSSAQETPQPHQHKQPPPQTEVSGAARHRLQDIPENEPSAMGHWLDDVTERMPSADEGVSTEPGPPPDVALSGASDPQRIQRIHQHSGGQLRREQERRASEPLQNFGEDRVAPQVGEQSVTSSIGPSQPGEGERCPQAETLEPYRFDDQDEADLSQRTQPQFADSYRAETSRVGQAESARDRSIVQARTRGEQDAEAAHRSNYAKQIRQTEQGRRDVDEQRRRWQDENRGVLSEYEESAEEEGVRAKEAIDEQVSETEGRIDERHGSVVDRANREEREAEKKAKELKKTAKEKKRSESLASRVGSWIKDKVVSIANWLSDQLEQVFQRLRETLSKLFERFKQWATEQIEKARKWVKQWLEQFRQWAQDRVDRYLARYPEIAAKFRRAINMTVDATQRAVDLTASALKRGVALLVDVVAATIDKALALAEGLLQSSLWALCNIAVSAINFAVFLIDQDIDALITLINELPEPSVLGPLWPAVKYALLGFLTTLRDQPAERKKRYVRKTRWLVLSPAYYGGAFVGVLKGFVWDGLVGLLVMVKDIVVGIPKAIKAMYDYFSRLTDKVEDIREMMNEAQTIWRKLKDFVSNPDNAEQVVSYLRQVPSVVHGMVSEAYQQVKGWAHTAGKDAANALFDFVLDSSHFQIGKKVGEVIGRVLFEVALLFFTSGVGTAVKWGGKILQVLGKAGRLLSSAAKGGSIIMRALQSLQSVVMRGVRLAQRIGKKLRAVFVRLENLVKKVFAWFRGAFSRVSGSAAAQAKRLHRRFGLSPAQRRRWRLFKLTLASRLRPYQENGISKRRLRGIFDDVVDRYRDVAKRPRWITQHEAYWRLWVRKVKSLPRVVDTVLLDRDERWDAGAEAIREAVNRYRRRPGYMGTRDVLRLLRPIKREYGFKGQPSVTFDEDDNEFVIRWSMSNTRVVANPGGEVPSRMNVFRPITPGRHVVLDNFTYHKNSRSDAESTTSTYDALSEILSAPKYKVSAYVRGHLLSGWFTHGRPSNWTPITRSANWWMAAKWETPVRRAMKSHAYIDQKILRGSTRRLKFYKMTIEATGSSSSPPQREYVDGSKPKTTVSEESGLATDIKMKIVRKMYDPESESFREDSSKPLSLPGVPKSESVTNVPSSRYPPHGYPYGKLSS